MKYVVNAATAVGSLNNFGSFNGPGDSVNAIKNS